jgi:SAM-dependent methyltransferase
MDIDIKEFYNKVAYDFDKSRINIWNCVAKYLDNFESKSYILDIGCGNGKNMLYRKDLKIKGIDISSELVKICKNKNLDVIEGNMTNLPFDDNTFDGLLSVASYHHLTNDIDRKKTIDEMYRVVKHNGLIFIEVWAKKFDNEKALWKSNKNITYLRYYHYYSENELANEIIKFKPELKIIYQGYEKENWFIILKKVI